MNIIILGASGGIGSTLFSELSKKHNIFIGSRDPLKIKTLINDCVAIGTKIDGCTVEGTSFESVEKFLKEAANFLESVDCIINCIGSILLKPAHFTSESEFDNVLKTNLYSCFAILKYSIQYMKNDGGNLIFFSSSASKIGLKNHEAIAAAKGAISSLVTSAASTYSKYNIRINAIAPGLVETNLTKKITSNPTSLKYSKELHGLKKIGKPENFIPLVNSLIDNRSSWITGQTFTVDGGLSNIK